MSQRAEGDRAVRVERLALVTEHLGRATGRIADAIVTESWAEDGSARDIQRESAYKAAEHVEASLHHLRRFLEGGPLPAPEGTMERIAEIVGRDAAGASPPIPVKGNRVRITDGPYTGRVGVVEDFVGPDDEDWPESTPIVTLIGGALGSGPTIHVVHGLEVIEEAMQPGDLETTVTTSAEWGLPEQQRPLLAGSADAPDGQKMLPEAGEYEKITERHLEECHAAMLRVLDMQLQPGGKAEAIKQEVRRVLREHGVELGEVQRDA